MTDMFVFLLEIIVIQSLSKDGKKRSIPDKIILPIYHISTELNVTDFCFILNFIVIQSLSKDDKKEGV
ncbi:MAG: hypothetical protein CVU11_10750 [Bacteroidetes bacterium HGW-Bacteroidetes-6]|nr:MAG: hypothetical protein CVU11_10750 [Bacteroidetes bacterium HGW-Bacteroidetes-6]